MAKFHGEVGYGTSVESSPGVWKDQITERTYFGDVLQNSVQMTESGTANDKLTVQNSISIVADEYAIQSFFAIRYVKWMGTLWEITDVKVQSPRLLLRLGGVYNGPTPAVADPS